MQFRTAKLLEKNTFVLVTNQQQIEGLSKKLLPLKTGPFLIIDKPTETTYILKDNNEEQITIHRSHIVPYYPKEKTHQIRTTKLSPNKRNTNTKTTKHINLHLKRYPQPGYKTYTSI